jgi:hypothetical protein
MQKSGFVHRKCAKCGGSLYLDNDSFGWYEQCLQCGRISDLQKVGQVKEISADTVDAEELAPAK